MNYVIYHRTDFDGIFCREIAYRNYPGAAFIGWNYGDPIPAGIQKDDWVGMLDITIDELIRHPRLIWIDHHKTSIEKYDKSGSGYDITGYRIDGVAACRLAWQWFNLDHQSSGSRNFGLPVKQDFIDRKVSEPLAVRLAGEYDVWDKRDSRVDDFQAGLRSRELTFKDWNILLSIGPSADALVKSLCDYGAQINSIRRRAYKELILSQGFDIELDGLKLLACCTHELDFGRMLFEAGIKPHHDGVMAFTFTGKDWRFGLYGVPNKPDIDLSKIAIKRGGGGHKQACGFRAKELSFIK